MNADPHSSGGGVCPYEMWASLPMSTRAPTSKKMGNTYHLSIPVLHLFRNNPLEVEFPEKLQLGHGEEKPHLLSTYSVPGIV